MQSKTIAVFGMAVAVALTSETGARAQAKPLPEDLIQKVTAALPDKPLAKPAKPQKIIIFTMTKGFRHSSIPLAAKTLELMGRKTGAWEATQTDDVAQFAADKLAPYDAVVMDQCTGEVFSDEALKKSLLEFVKNGKGIVGIHAATDCFGKWPEYGDMMGGYFKGHPFNHISVKVDDPASALTAMFENKGFEIKDEIYTFKEPYSREKLRILLSLDWPNSGIKKGNREDNDYALSWIREFDKGRVFYFAFGHQDHIFCNKALMAHLLAGVQYALGDLKADATPSAKAKLEAAPGPNLAPKTEKPKDPAPAK